MCYTFEAQNKANCRMNADVEKTIAFVKEILAGAEGGHDWFHIERVWKNARYIHDREKKGDRLVVELAALLHDISDPKFNGGDELKGMMTATAFLEKEGLDGDRIDHVGMIIRHMGFKGGKSQEEIHSIEFQIVQDADRLDAMGAIGIARAFNYGGHKNRLLHDPAYSIREYKSVKDYRRSPAPTIAHFHEKLLKLKELMNTPTGKAMAGERHRYMLDFLDQFHREWDPGDRQLEN